MMYDYGYRNSYDAWGALMMFVLMVLVLVGGVLLVRYLIRSAAGQTPDSAIDILKKRYAKGEIDKQEFNDKRKELKD